MSGGDRSGRPSSKLIAGGIAAATGLVGIAAAITYGLSQESAYERDAKREASYYSEYAAAKKQQACDVVAKAERPRCLAKAQTEYELEAHQSRHNAADLVAQRKSALWAGIMGWAALLGMALSAIGVSLVWITFREQQRATNLAHAEAERAKAEAVESGKLALEALSTAQRNADAAAEHVKVAQNTANAQLRAYLSVKSVEMDRESFGEDADAVMLEVVNHGQTPATIIRLQVNVDWFPTGGEAISFLKHDGHLAFDCHQGTPVSMPLKLTDPEMFPDSPGTMSVVGVIDYKDVFGKTRTVTFSFSGSPNVDYFDMEHGMRFSAMSKLNGQYEKRRKRQLPNNGGEKRSVR